MTSAAASAIVGVINGAINMAPITTAAESETQSAEAPSRTVRAGLSADMGGFPDDTAGSR